MRIRFEKSYAIFLVFISSCSSGYCLSRYDRIYSFKNIFTTKLKTIKKKKNENTWNYINSARFSKPNTTSLIKKYRRSQYLLTSSKFAIRLLLFNKGAVGWVERKGKTSSQKYQANSPDFKSIRDTPSLPDGEPWAMAACLRLSDGWSKGISTMSAFLPNV